jgi:hypothetical protein
MQFAPGRIRISLSVGRVKTFLFLGKIARGVIETKFPLIKFTPIQNQLKDTTFDRIFGAK